VEETRDELVLTAELPGLREADVDIKLENSVLTIQGRKEETREEGQEEQRSHLWERSYGSFQRSFTLPRTVLADKISATFQDGVLHVRVPKAPESKGRKIEIRSATCFPASRGPAASAGLSQRERSFVVWPSG